MQGRIKKLKKDKGYGFIVPENGGDDIFFHASGVNEPTYDELQEEDRVTYELEDGRDGRKRAVNVRRL